MRVLWGVGGNGSAKGFLFSFPSLLQPSLVAVSVHTHLRVHEISFNCYNARDPEWQSHWGSTLHVERCPGSNPWPPVSQAGVQPLTHPSDLMSISISLFVCGFGPYLVILRSYSQFCAQVSLLAVFWGGGSIGVKPRPPAYKS